MKINGFCAVVTGGAMGIGLATVKRLLNEGCLVSIWEYNEKAIEEAKTELKDFTGKVFFHYCDVRDKNKVYELAKKAKAEMGVVHFLINNAGIVTPGMFSDAGDDKHIWTYEINLLALTYTINAVLPSMYEQNFGVVVNISSAAGVLGVPGMASYSASKWAVFGLTESLRHEARNLKKNVRFVSIHPSYLATGLFEGARMKGLGRLIVPPVKNHDVIAKAIVKSALRRKKTVIYRPRSVRTALLLRGIFPDKFFFAIIRFLRIHESMNSWKGRQNG